MVTSATILQALAHFFAELLHVLLSFSDALLCIRESVLEELGPWSLPASHWRHHGMLGVS